MAGEKCVTRRWGIIYHDEGLVAKILEGEILGAPS